MSGFAQPDRPGQISDIPQAHPLVRAAHGEGLAVRAERHRDGVARRARQRAADMHRAGQVADVPQPGQAVRAGHRESMAVRAERYRERDGAGVPDGGQRARIGRVSDRPQPQGPVVTAGGQ